MSCLPENDAPEQTSVRLQRHRVKKPKSNRHPLTARRGRFRGDNIAQVSESRALPAAPYTIRSQYASCCRPLSSSVCTCSLYAHANELFLCKNTNDDGNFRHFTQGGDGTGVSVLIYFSRRPAPFAKTPRARTRMLCSPNRALVIVRGGGAGNAVTRFQPLIDPPRASLPAGRRLG